MEAITFKRDGDAVTIKVSLKKCMEGRTSKGNPGSYGSAKVQLSDDHDVKLNLNVFQTKRKAQTVSL